MKLRIKLTSTVVAFLLILGLTIMGVFALPTVNVTLKGSLTFNATNVSATVSGTIANTKAEEQPTLTPLTYKAEYTDEEQTALTNAEKEWEDCDLSFKNDGSAIVITIRITNNATDRSLYASINQDLENCNFENVKTTMTNKTETKDYTGEVLTILANANSNINYVDIEISMEVDNKNTSLTKDATYGFNIELNNEKPVEPVRTIDYYKDMLIFSEYNAENKELSVKGVNTYSGAVVIPEKVLYQSEGGELSEWTVSNIPNGSANTTNNNNAFEYNTQITSVTLPKTIKSIGNFAFKGCSELKSINLDNLTSIGAGAFNGCSGLTSVELKNIKSVLAYTFEGCTGLTTIDLSSCTSLGEDILHGCTGLKEIILSSKCTSIQTRAFRDCTNSELRVKFIGTESDWQTLIKDKSIEVLKDLDLSKVTFVIE